MKDNIVTFEPKDDGQPTVEADPLGVEPPAPDVNLADYRVGANIIYGSLSSIDLATTTPEVFWSIFDTPGARKWLTSALGKLNSIKDGMPPL